MLSHLVDEAALMGTLRRYIGLIIPGDSVAVLEQVCNILEHREAAGWVVLGAMLFFSSLAFSVLESAMSIIFIHRVRHKPRPLIVSLLLPYPLHPHARRGLPGDDGHCEPAAIDER
jgi:membrane protein